MNGGVKVSLLSKKDVKAIKDTPENQESLDNEARL
jgi:hypothetical protein